MSNYTKKGLLKKAEYHAEKANTYYRALEIIERKESLIGFRIKKDNRTSSDKYEIELSQSKWHDIQD